MRREKKQMTQQRMTRQKQIILDVARAHHDHPTAEQIYLEVSAIDKRISRGTVYRDLGQLSDSGDILHVKVPGPDRFDCRTGLHYHMICTGCGAVFDAPVDYETEIDKEVFEKSGFHVQRHRTVFEGLCPECIKKSKEKKEA